MYLFSVNDHLITFFIHKEKSYETNASMYSKECVAEAKMNLDNERITASRMLKIVDNHSVKDSDIRPKCYNIVSQNK